MKVLGIIPARGGSKGVPGKNKMLIDGKPLIGYSIEAALGSQLLNEVWVSTDDPDIVALSLEYPELRIHKRSSVISKDNSPVSETIQSVLKTSMFEPDLVVLLQPTSPLRTSLQIDEAIILINDNPKANSLISVIPMDHVHPARMYWKEGHDLSPIFEIWEMNRRQDIPLAWYRNGSIYIVRKEAFEKEHSVMIKPSIGYVMSPGEWLNIDAPRDVIIANALIPAWKNDELK